MKIFLLFILFLTSFKCNENAFFSLMLTNPTVLQQVKQIENNLTNENQQFIKFIYNISYLHVKLNRIEFNQSFLSNIEQFMKDLPGSLCNVSYNVPVLFEGTAIKNNKTLYGKMNAMSSSVISSVHQAIYKKLNLSGITSLDEHNIFHPTMDIVELDNQKHDDLLQIMNNRSSDFHLSTGDFVKEIVLWNSKKSGYFHSEISRIKLVNCSELKYPWKTELITNRVNDVSDIIDFL